MDKSEERVRILKMVQSGHISAEEAALLLKALDQGRPGQKPQPPAMPSREPRQVRILVTDLSSGKEKVNVKMAWNLLSVGVKMGAHFAHDDIRMEDLVAAVQAGAVGKVLEMVDQEDKERVEVFVE